jgi:aminoglycoside phosphotransferase (APT) family kinase protein
VSIPSADPPPDGGVPAADVPVDVPLPRRLGRAQYPALADLPVTPAGVGLDNATFRLGDELALRLPRRRAAAALVAHEQRWLPLLGPRLPLRVPVPVGVGAPQREYPWAWSIVPWLPGATADHAPPGDDQGEVLAAFLDALHTAAPAEAPHNPYRGVPLAARASAFAERVRRLAARGRALDDRLLAIWHDALAAPPASASTWIHGDPHPRNVLVVDGRLTAVIDWGDLARGDRATDLAAVWMLLPHRAARERAMAAYRHASTATWRRARGWAAFFAVTLLDAGLANDPPTRAIGEAIGASLLDGP